jgi:tryptophanyl-tRNA synthetase
LAKLYKGGNFGYGQAKQILFDKSMELFGTARSRYTELMEKPNEIEDILKAGAIRAEQKADEVLSRVKTLVGF